MSQPRVDQAQLIITIDAKESAAYQSTLRNTAAGVAQMKKLTAGTEEFNKALNDQAAISKKLLATDYMKLSTKQLQDRRGQLIQLQRMLPQVTFAEAGFEKELQKVNAALTTASQRTRAVSASLNESDSAFKRLGRSILSVAGGFALWEGAKSIFKSTIGSAINLASTFETTSASFKILIGDQERAVALMKELNAFSTATPFEPAEVQAAAKTLLGYGRSAETVLSDIEILGNAAAATGADLKGLSLVFGQVAGAGKLMGQDALQFINQGVPVYQILGDMLGKSGAEIKELQSQGRITFDMLREAFKRAAEDGGKFAGALEAQSKTMSGLFSTLRGNIDEFIKRIGDRMIPVLKPALAFLGQFFEGLTQNLFEGKKATGEFADVINTAADVIRGVGNAIAIVGAGIVTFVEVLRSIPQFVRENKDTIASLLVAVLSLNSAFIAGAIASRAKAAADIYLAAKTKIVTFATKGLNKAFKANPIGFVIGLVAALAAGMITLYNNSETVRRIVGGLWAALKQGAENAVNGVKTLIANIQIFGKEVQLAITFDSNKKAQLRQEIAELKKMRAEYQLAGRTLGQAFSEGYNDPSHAKPKKSEKSAEEEERLAKEKAEAEAKLQAELEAKKSKKKEKKEKAAEPIILGDLTAPEDRQKFIDFQVKLIQDAGESELTELKKQHLEGKIETEQYEIERLRIAKEGILRKIDLLRSMGDEESDMMKQLQVELLENDKALTEQRIKQIEGLENTQLDALENQYLKRLISEEEYQQARLKIQSDFFAEQLRMMEENGLTETEAYKKLVKLKLQADFEYSKKKEEQQQRQIDMERKILNEGMAAYSGLLSAAADYLAADERNRRKHGEAIRAFQIASIMTDGLAEIAGIFKSTAGWGPIGWAIGIAQAATAGIRTAAALSKTRAQQFWQGGQIQSVSGSVIDAPANIPTLPGGDNVLIAAKAGEVVLNQDQQRRAGGADFFRRLGVPGFAGGGMIPQLPNTTPTLSPRVLSPTAPQSLPDPRLDVMIAMAHRMTEAVSAMPAVISNMNLKTHVVYSDLEQAGSDISEIRRLSSY
ncbi:MAG TPA: tape measure protein [Candidatus Woesebacteria bacterium]|nr:tape measure protein [Candidatus Woesebacteria bacterium]